MPIADTGVLTVVGSTGYFPAVIADIKDSFEELKHELAPDLIFTHYREDLHQDHRTLAELTWNTFRDHLILEYEIPKYDGGMGSLGLHEAPRYISKEEGVAGPVRWFEKLHFQVESRFGRSELLFEVKGKP